ncbi:MAG: hypothetical protein K2X73_10835 [Sphingomonas sp.]|uniref:hypothetical protein n=1 Tax=Sphingomonas sp. TaxID=28214 RepID=UPI0025F63C57|nr:hypothetical protein [Sphingomonas sp.]MBX9882454.1 hypothetical protein [Sphingomonas sp.]
MTTIAVIPHALIVLATVVAMARTVRHARRMTPTRLAMLVALQLVSALLLMALLAPETGEEGAEELTIATEGTPASSLVGANKAIIALPNALPGWSGERAPDLATALRRHPGARQLRILGWGLTRDDRAAVRGMAVIPALTPPPPGITGIHAPDAIAPGMPFTVGVTTTGLKGASIELLDPAGTRVERVLAGDDAAPVALRATARTAGNYRFALRVVRSGEVVETADVPVRVTTSQALRVSMSGGAPSAEWKFLRRWAADAGMTVNARFATGGAIAIGDLDADRPSDLTMLDDRSWAALDGGARARLIALVRGGMGLILRASGPIPADVRASWVRLGLPVMGSGRLVPVRIDGTASTDHERADLGFGGGAVPIARAADDAVLAAWRPLGIGRVAIVSLTDSYAWVQTGDPARHARFWSDIAAAVARPGSATADPPAIGQVGTRVALCGLISGTARVVPPEGAPVPVLRDRATGTRSCGGYWPRSSGWHHLDRGEEPAIAFFVRPAGSLVSASAAERGDATRALAALGDREPARADTPATVASAALAVPRWLWFLGWMVAAASLWWLERSRLGRR